jgi:hypothetical protein
MSQINRNVRRAYSVNVPDCHYLVFIGPRLLIKITTPISLEMLNQSMNMKLDLLML